MTTARRGWGLLRYVGLTPSSATQAPPPQRGHFYSVREGVISIGGQQVFLGWLPDGNAVVMATINHKITSDQKKEIGLCGSH